MARRSQCSSAGDNPLDPNYLPPHYREDYRLAIDALIEEDLDGYYQFLQKADVVDFLSAPEIEYIQSSVQVPQQSFSLEQHFVESEGDGSSDTYWPIHSDLDAPGLDLGWPHLHHFIGPTEVTTLVNPAEPDMPSIKEQARRLIKNAQQVVAIVMDMFTDVDMFADILDAAMRNVAVYILLDKQNAHHFVNMVSNCRVNLQSIQMLRVRTVSGITYHCRTGKSFNGQMLDRFLLTDCRAVLSGNYSFMWSFEKIHRCMAHLFLGQLVSTFDEEFRILFAQSHPLIVENYAPVEEFGVVQKRPYLSERALYREPKKFNPLDAARPEEWPRHSYDDRTDMDWRHMKKQEAMQGPVDIYGRLTSQHQPRMDPSFDPGPSRLPMMENLAFKRHSYAEGGRYPYPFMQQGTPEPENQGGQFHRGQQPGPGPGPEYSGYDKFWNQDFYSADQCSESGQEMDPLDNFDPVLNYLSSTRNVDFDQSSEKSQPAPDLPIGSPHLRRMNLGQPHPCQTSPTSSNPTDQKSLLQEPNADRKDPMVKRGLRNWRISSYLSAYDNSGEEDIPSAPLNAPDPFEEPSNPTPGTDLSVPKIPNVREFKVPAIPRPSHIPNYAKMTTREQPKKLADEATAAEEPKTTPTPSESSSSTEVEKIEEAEQKEQKEPKSSVLRRDDSFRRNYNAAVQRSSRLRSSLIFSSLEQQHAPQDTKPTLEQHKESDKDEAEHTKLPFVSQVLGQRKREPYEWSRYMKSATFDNSTTDQSKADEGNDKQDDKDSAKNTNVKDISEEKESGNASNKEQSKPPEAMQPKTDQPAQLPKSLLTSPAYVDMNDPDNRLMFFKELAAKRKAAKAAEAAKSKEKVKPASELKDDATVKKEEVGPKETSENIADTPKCEDLLDKKAGAKDAGKTLSTEALSHKNNKLDSRVETDPDTSQSLKPEQSRADSEQAELNNSQSAASLPVSAEIPSRKTPEEPKLSSPAAPTQTHPAPASTAPPASAPASATPASSPPASAPPTSAAPIISPPTNATPASATPAIAHPTSAPPVSAHPTSAPPASAPPVSATPASASPTSSPPTSAPPASAPPASALPASAPPASASPTSAPPASAPPASATPASASPTSAPPASAPPASAPPASAPPASATPASAPPTSAPANAPPASVPPTSALPANAPPAISTPASAPPANATLASAPPATAPPAHASPASAPPSSAPSATALPARAAPALAAPTSATTASAPPATVPPATAPPASAPPATAPSAHASPASAPPDTAPPSIAPSATALPAHAAPTSATTASASPATVPPATAPPASAPPATTPPATEPPASASPASDILASAAPAIPASASPASAAPAPAILASAAPASAALASATPAIAAPASAALASAIPASAATTSAIPASAAPTSAIPASAAPASALSLAQETDESKKVSLEVPPSPNTQNPESVQSQTSVPFILLPEQHPGADHILPNSGSQVNPSPSPFSCAPKDTHEDSSSSTISPNAQETLLPSSPEPSQVTSSETPSAAKTSAHVESNKSTAGSTPDLSQSSTKEDCAPTPSEKTDPEPESKYVPSKKESTSEPLSKISDLASVSAHNQTTSPTPSPEETPPKHSATSSPVHPALNSSETQATTPSQLNLTGSVTSTEKVSCSSPQTESVGSVLSPEAEKTSTAPDRHLDSLPKQNVATSTLPAAEMSSPPELTSEVLPEPDLPCKTPESVSSETQPSEKPVPAETSQVESQNEVRKDPEKDHSEKKADAPEVTNEVNKTTTQEPFNNEKTNKQVEQNNCTEPPSDEAIPPSMQSKQPKSNQTSRYQSSTANVLSSSNLRDDTKLLLEQISANNQSRNETAKESPVTDDEKEDEADKKAKMVKERGVASLNRGQQKTNDEREKALERIQSMRKERKVYSRFEMAPY